MELILSIITTTFNARNEIVDTIKCVGEIKKIIENSGFKAEYIVVDGSSTDGTVDLIKKYYELGVIDKYLSEKDDGIYNAMNKGLNISSGEYVLVLGAGDVFLPFKTGEVIRIIANERPDIIYGNQVMVKKNAKRLARVFIPGEFSRTRLRFGWHPPHASTIIRRSILSEIGGFDEKYGIAADIKMHWLSFQLAQKVVYINDFLSVFPLGGASNKSFRNILKANLQSYFIAKEVGFKIPIISVSCKMLRKLAMKIETIHYLRNDSYIKDILNNI